MSKYKQVFFCGRGFFDIMVADHIEKIASPFLKARGKINFPLVFHLHQPIAQFEHVFHEAFEKSYLPLLLALERHPKTKAAFHITGPLIEWLVENKIEYIEKIRKLVKKNQLELISGGYYEPILAMIPDDDKIQQITMLNDKIKELFDFQAKGLWLAERAWEPHLPSVLAEARIEYVFIDDNHVKTAGIEPPHIHHTFVTEDQGSKVIVFPINEEIRYLIPWKPIDQTIRYLQSQLDPNDSSLVITSIDDAEKLGLWPAGKRTTFDICYGEGHTGYPLIDEWFGLVEALPWIRSLTPKEYNKEFSPKGIIYLPSTSYDKMGIWVLPAQLRKQAERLIHLAKQGKIVSANYDNLSPQVKKFVKGGFWRQFLVKYPESNRMHKRMYWTRSLLEEAITNNMLSKDSWSKLRNQILAAQCNDAYWHGQFGGVYYVFMRTAIYRHLLTVHSSLWELGILQPSLWIERDFDYDGNNELIYDDGKYFIVLSPHEGGSIIEIDDLISKTNILNVLTRQEESYHDPELAPVDLWTKTAFRDFSLAKTKLSRYMQNPKQIGESVDYVDTYEWIAEEKSVRMKGFTRSRKHAIEKRVTIKNGKIALEYAVPRTRIAFHTEIPIMLDDAQSAIQIHANNENYSLGLKPVQIITREMTFSCSNPRQPRIRITTSQSVQFSFCSLSPWVLEESSATFSYQGILVVITFPNVGTEVDITLEVLRT